VLAFDPFASQAVTRANCSLHLLTAIMGRPKSVSIQERASLFKEDKFYVSDSTILMCGICNSRLEWEKLDTLKKHVKTSGHVTKKESHRLAEITGAGTKRQITITDMDRKTKKAKTEKDNFISDTVKMCLKANIPLEKLDHPAVREYLKT
jgi:hypothetical protein